MTAPLLIAGDSHTVALVGFTMSVPVEEPPVVRPVEGHDGLCALHGPWPRRDYYWEALIGAAETHAVAISWGGNEHNGLFLIEGNRPFDFVYNRNPDLGLDERAEIVPEALVKASFTDLAKLGPILAQLAEHQRHPVIVIGPPPPKPDGERIWQCFFGPGAEAEAYFCNIIAQRGLVPEDVRVTSAGTRLKLWLLVQDDYERIARENGAVFLPPPAVCVDPDGFLRREYSAEDSTHANSAYGAVVLAELKELIGE